MANRVVNVRAAAGDQFCRGGHRFPGAPGRTVRVTPELLAILKAEKQLAVDLEPEDADRAEPDVLEYESNMVAYDHEHNAARESLLQNAELKRRKLNLEAMAENKRLQEEIAALKAGKAPKADPKSDSDKK